MVDSLFFGCSMVDSYFRMLPNRLRPRYGLEKCGLIGVDLNREYK